MLNNFSFRGVNFRAVNVVLMTVTIAIASWFWMPPAWAITQIKLSDMAYHDCPAKFSQGLVTSDGSGRAANCFMVTGKAKNPSNKMVYDADVYGRIFDAQPDAGGKN